VEEETGFDLSGRINPDDFIKTQINAQEVTMFIVKDIDESTVFETQTRKEIGAIEWVPFLDLPTWAQKKGPKRTGGQGQKKFYNVTPFVGPLKKWLQKRGINSYPKRRVEAVPATRQRDLQPFTFDDMPSLPATTSQISHAGHEHPTTALDHLFAKFIQKDDNVTALESDNARTLDQLFGGLDQTPSTQASEDDALAQLLGGLTTVAPPPALPEKQSKLLAVLGGGEQQQQNIHQTNLLSMLSPPKGPRATLAPAVHPSAPLQAPAAGDAGDRHHRQQALLQSMFMGPNNAAPVTPPGPVVLRPQVTASPASGMISPMPPMPPSQAAWQPPPPSGLSGLQSGSPLRVPPQTPPQMPRTGPPAHLFTPPAHVSPQQAARVHPQYSPQQYAQTSPRPPVNNHQRALLGTLFNANRPMQGYNGPGIGAPSNMPPMANGRPPNGLPNAYPNPQFVPFQGMPPQGQFSSQSGFFNAPPPFMGPGGHGGPGGPGGPHCHMPPPGMQGMHSHGNQGLQHPRPPGLSGPPPGLTNNESTGPAVPAHPAPQPQALTPGAAVHQPVPRPPVGGGLLGLINGTIG
jgi:mRNA-decapping enzyme subunit 2